MAQNFILFDDGPNGGTEAFSDPTEVISAWEPEEVSEAFERLQQAHNRGKWLAGYASYELGYALEPKLAEIMPQGRKSPLMCFGVFDEPDANAARSLAHQGRADQDNATLDPPKPLWSGEDYEKAFDQVSAYIRAGDFYQTNLTFPMESRYEGSALGLHAALRRVQPVSFGAVIDLGEGPVIVSRSPELFFRINKEGVIETRPMKGTVPRGETQAQDDELKTFLAQDEKNRAENLMIVDLLRNDISRVAEIGSVKVPELFTIETYATVHQMTSLIQAKMRRDIGLFDLFSALFPCGSITGAPKIRAMEVIRELEPAARDIYCGSVGWIAPDGSMSFNVAIRTLSLFEDNSVTLNVGGGVVYDSTAASEYEEALWKARYTKLHPLV